MLELRMIAGSQALSPFDLPSVLGRSNAAREIGDTIDALIAFMDDLGGDPDLEDGGDDEPSGDESDVSWPEWHSRGRHKLAGNIAEMAETRSMASQEDVEEDDPAGGNVEDEPHDPEEDCCVAGDDGCAPVWRNGVMHWGFDDLAV